MVLGLRSNWVSRVVSGVDQRLPVYPRSADDVRPVPDFALGHNRK
jgi:hypothetical protein